jgi:asparagine N-glycosylation enzyme membrane subunit Stt3
MTTREPNVDYWSLTSPQLAAQIDHIAHADPMDFNNATRAESHLLAEEWHEALNLPQEAFEQQEARRARIAALQRRSIEILIHASSDLSS